MKLQNPYIHQSDLTAMYLVGYSSTSIPSFGNKDGDHLFLVIS